MNMASKIKMNPDISTSSDLKACLHNFKNFILLASLNKKRG
jgi:hypothetical protein